MERRWKEGDFADEKAKARINSALTWLVKYRVPQPKMHKQLISEYKAKKLNGARLELTAQLLEVEVEKLKKGLQ